MTRSNPPREEQAWYYQNTTRQQRKHSSTCYPGAAWGEHSSRGWRGRWLLPWGTNCHRRGSIQVFLVESVNSGHGLNGVWCSSKNSPNNFILPRWFCSFYSLLQSKDYLCFTAFYSDTYYFQKLIHSASATPRTLACIRQLRCLTSSTMAPKSRR